MDFTVESPAELVPLLRTLAERYTRAAVTNSPPGDLAEQPRDRREHERARGDPARRRSRTSEPTKIQNPTQLTASCHAYMWLRLRSAPVANTSVTCTMMNATK